MFRDNKNESGRKENNKQTRGNLEIWRYLLSRIIAFARNITLNMMKYTQLKYKFEQKDSIYGAIYNIKAQSKLRHDLSFDESTSFHV